MPVLPFIVLIVSHVSDRGEKYGRLSVIREVQKTGADGRRYRAALCRCDCGKEVTTRISSLKSGYACVDCGEPAQDWSTVDPSSDDVRVRFQPRCRKCHRHYDGTLGEGNPRAKLTAGKVRELRARRADGLTYQQLATEFGISDVSAWAAVNGKTWAHVN